MNKLTIKKLTDKTTCVNYNPKKRAWKAAMYLTENGVTVKSFQTYHKIFINAVISRYKMELINRPAKAATSKNFMYLMKELGMERVNAMYNEINKK